VTELTGKPASSVTGRSSARATSADLYGLAAAVPTTGWAHDVRQLRFVALRAEATSRTLEDPVRGPTAAALRL